MKKLIFAVLLILSIPLAIANHPVIKDPEFVEVTFQIDHQSNDSEWKINNKLSLQNNNRWINIGGLQTSPPPSSSSQDQQPPFIQSLALIKIVNADSTKVTLEFLMINKEFDYYAVNHPRLVINYNQKGGIDILDKKNTTHIKISAIAHVKA